MKTMLAMILAVVMGSSCMAQNMGSGGGMTISGIGAGVSSSTVVRIVDQFRYWKNGSNVQWYTWVTNGNEIQIRGYSASGPSVMDIPEYIDGLPVTILGGLVGTVKGVPDPNLFTVGTNVTSVTGGRNLRVIGMSVFRHALITSVSFQNVETVKANAFQGSSVRIVSLPKATSVDSTAFWYCTSLETVYLNSVQSIGTRAFASCDVLTAIYIDGDAPSVASKAFEYSPYLGVYVLSPLALGYEDTLGGATVHRQTCFGKNNIVVVDGPGEEGDVLHWVGTGEQSVHTGRWEAVDTGPVFTPEDYATADQGVAATNAQARVAIVETNTVTLAMTNGAEWGSHSGLATVAQLNSATNDAVTDATSRVAGVGYLLPASTQNLATVAQVAAATNGIDGAFIASKGGLTNVTLQMAANGGSIITNNNVQIGELLIDPPVAPGAVLMPAPSAVGIRYKDAATNSGLVIATGLRVLMDTSGVANVDFGDDIEVRTNLTATGSITAGGGFFGNGAGLTNIPPASVNGLSLYSAPVVVTNLVLNTTNLTLAPVWSETNTINYLTASTGSVTIAPTGWPAGRYAEMLVSLRLTSNCNIILPTNAPRLANGTFTYTAPSIRTNALLYFVHTPHEYWYMAATNDAPIGTP